MSSRFNLLILISIIVGTTIETLAHVTHAWRYDPEWMVFSSWMLLYVLGMPLIAYYTMYHSPRIAYVFGFFLSLVYMILDIYDLHWLRIMSHFASNYPMLSHILLALLWGFIPVLVIQINRGLGFAEEFLRMKRILL